MYYVRLSQSDQQYNLCHNLRWKYVPFRVRKIASVVRGLSYYLKQLYKIGLHWLQHML